MELFKKFQTCSSKIQNRYVRGQRQRQKQRDTQRQRKAVGRRGAELNCKWGILWPSLQTPWKCASYSCYIYSSRNNWQSCNKKGGKSQITLSSPQPRSLPPTAQSIWQEPAVSGSRCSSQALAVTSGIWELGEKLTKWSEADEEILRGSAFPTL